MRLRLEVVHRDYVHCPPQDARELPVPEHGARRLVYAPASRRVRPRHLRTPDATQVAAARLYGADAIVTNNRRWEGQVTQPALVMLDDYISA